MRFSICVASLCVLAFAVASAPNDYDVIDEYQLGSAATRIIRLRQASVTATDLESLAIKAELGLLNVDLRHVIVVTRESDAGQQVLNSRRTYTKWREQSVKYEPPDVAELLSMSDCSSTRIRINGQITSRTLRGRNCFDLSIDNERYELIHLAPWRRPVGAYGNRLTFFVTGKADKDRAERLLTNIRGRVQGSPIEVIVRSDVWFGSYPQFPPRSVFEDPVSPVPSPGELSGTLTVQCVSFWPLQRCLTSFGVLEYLAP